MKISYLSSTKLPSCIADSVHIMKMCQALVKNGHEVFLIGPTKSKDKEVNVFDFYNVDECFKITYISKLNVRIIGRIYNSYLSVKKAINFNPDLVYTRNETTAYLASINGLPTVYESHTPVCYSHWGSYRNLIFKKLIKRKELRLIVVISEELKKYYLKNYNLASSDILLARDGADIIHPNVNPILFHNKRKIQIGYIGSLNEGRGKSVIRALAENCNFAQFHIIGGNPDENSSWKEYMKLNNITFHGHFPHSKIDSFLMGLDILLAPYQKMTKTETGINTTRWMSPLKIFEYMAAGKPIIASDLPAIREILEHEENAILCNPEDTEEWKEALLKLQKNPSMRVMLGNNARDKFKQNYTWDNRAKFITKELEARI
jgi:glycosyltransferase involved in cell wall biosynthesis